MEHRSILLNSEERSLSPNRLECSVCKQRFWMTSKYLDHMSSHKQLLLSCNICNKSFYNQKLLDAHYLSHNEVINTYDCSKCTRKFLQKHQLEQHMDFHPISIENPSLESKKKKVSFNNILESKDISDEDVSSGGDSDQDNNSDGSEDCKDDPDWQMETKEDSDSDWEKKKTYDCDWRGECKDDPDWNDDGKIKKTSKSQIGKTKKLNKFKKEAKHKRCKKSGRVLVKMPVSGTVLQPKILAVATNTDQLPKKKLNKAKNKIPNNKSSEKTTASQGKWWPKSVKQHRMKFKHLRLDHTNSKKNSWQTARLDNLRLRLNNANLKKAVLEAAKNISFDVKPNEINVSSVDNLNVSGARSTVTLPPINKNSPSASITPINDSNKVESESVEKLNVSDMRSTVSCASANKNSPSASVMPGNISDKVKSIQNKSFGNLNISGIKSTVSFPPAKKNYLSASVTPRVEKQFLYVGPKEDLDKITNIIDKVKNMTNEIAEQHSNVALSAAEGNKNASMSNNCKQNNSSTSLNFNLPNSPSLKRSLPAITDSQNSNPAKCFKNDSLFSQTGILSTKIVNNFIVVKVTPEKMKEMQQETLQSQSNFKINSSGSYEKTTVDSNSPIVSHAPISIAKESVAPIVTITSKTNEMNEKEKLHMNTELTTKEKEPSSTEVSDKTDLMDSNESVVQTNISSVNVSLSPTADHIYSTNSKKVKTSVITCGRSPSTKTSNSDIEIHANAVPVMQSNKMLLNTVFNPNKSFISNSYVVETPSKVSIIQRDKNVLFVNIPADSETHNVSPDIIQRSTNNCVVQQNVNKNASLSTAVNNCSLDINKTSLKVCVPQQNKISSIGENSNVLILYDTDTVFNSNIAEISTKEISTQRDNSSVRDEDLSVNMPTDTKTASNSVITKSSEYCVARENIMANTNLKSNLNTVKLLVVQVKKISPISGKSSTTPDSKCFSNSDMDQSSANKCVAQETKIPLTVENSSVAADIKSVSNSGTIKSSVNNSVGQENEISSLVKSSSDLDGKSNSHLDIAKSSEACVAHENKVSLIGKISCLTADDRTVSSSDTIESSSENYHVENISSIDKNSSATCISNFDVAKSSAKDNKIDLICENSNVINAVFNLDIAARENNLLSMGGNSNITTDTNFESHSHTVKSCVARENISLIVENSNATSETKCVSNLDAAEDCVEERIILSIGETLGVKEYVPNLGSIKSSVENCDVAQENKISFIGKNLSSHTESFSNSDGDKLSSECSVVREIKMADISSTKLTWNSDTVKSSVEHYVQENKISSVSKMSSPTSGTQCVYNSDDVQLSAENCVVPENKICLIVKNSNKVMNTYDCTKCTRKFLQKRHLEQHMDFHPTSIGNPPLESEKKRVSPNSILESKDISDENVSSSCDPDEDDDSDWCGECNDPNSDTVSCDSDTGTVSKADIVKPSSENSGILQEFKNSLLCENSSTETADIQFRSITNSDSVDSSADNSVAISSFGENLSINIPADAQPMSSFSVVNSSVENCGPQKKEVSISNINSCTNIQTNTETLSYEDIVRSCARDCFVLLNKISIDCLIPKNSSINILDDSKKFYNSYTTEVSTKESTTRKNKSPVIDKVFVLNFDGTSFNDRVSQQNKMSNISRKKMPSGAKRNSYLSILKTSKQCISSVNKNPPFGENSTINKPAETKAVSVSQHNKVFEINKSLDANKAMETATISNWNIDKASKEYVSRQSFTINRSANIDISKNASIAEMFTKKFMAQQSNDLINVRSNNTPSVTSINAREPKIKLSNRVLELYKSKLEEKERKKKEKYEQKKRLRYIEKDLSNKYCQLQVNVAKKEKVLDSQTVEGILESQPTISPKPHELEGFNYRINSKPDMAEQNAIEKAREICLKFEKTLSEAEYHSCLSDLDSLITSFNISKKCLFIFKTLRFCRMYVESYDVKEHAILLHKKITKSLRKKSCN